MTPQAAQIIQDVIPLFSMNVDHAINEAINYESGLRDLSFAADCRKLISHGVSVNDGIGFHGTTVTAIVRMAQTGIFPTGIQDGSIYFYPRPSKILIENPKCVLPESDIDAFDGCISYAQTIAGEALLLRVLGRGFEFRTEWSEFLHHTLDEDGLYDIGEYLRRNYYADEIQFIAEDIGVKKLRELGKKVFSLTGGVLVALSEGILQDFTVEEAAPDDDGLRIICPAGISIEYFTGLLALGDYEEDILEKCGITSGST